jgi:putative ABC transport system permease protein
LDRAYARAYAPLYLDILSRLQHLPTVRAAALAAEIPLSESQLSSTGSIGVIGRPLVALADRPRISDAMVSPEFFHTLGIRLIQGRIFDDHDFAGIPAAQRRDFLQREAVVVNKAFVRRIFPNENPLGQRLVWGPDDFHSTWTIVGVVADVRGTALSADPPSMIYRCTCSSVPIYFTGLVVRTAGPPESAIRAIEQQVRAVDPDQPISDVKTMDQRRDEALAPERFQLMLLGSFAGIAILLAAAGVYGTTSYLVARRTREIGIRMAMGARQADVLRMVLGETSSLAVMAIAAGLGGAWAVTRDIRSMLYGVSELDPTTFAATALGPTRRAVRIDPMTALRDE